MGRAAWNADDCARQSSATIRTRYNDFRAFNINMRLVCQSCADFCCLLIGAHFSFLGHSSNLNDFAARIWASALHVSGVTDGKAITRFLVMSRNKLARHGHHDRANMS